MKSLVLTPELEQIASRAIWFEPPENAIANPARFLAYVMTYGDIADVNVVRRQLTDADLREAMENAPAGIFDGPSWAYWNLKLGRYPAPPMPHGFFDTRNARRSGTIGEFDQGLDANGFPR
jgi:hypothetical protein